MAVGKDLTRRQESGGFEAVQHRIHRAGAETVPVTQQLFDNGRSVHLALTGVVHDVHLYRAAREVSDHVHYAIDSRYRYSIAN